MIYKIQPYIAQVKVYNDYDGEYFHEKEIKQVFCFAINNQYIFDFNTGELLPPLDKEENGNLYNLVYANQMYIDFLIKFNTEDEEKLLPLCVKRFKEIIAYQEQEENKKIIKFRKPLI